MFQPLFFCVKLLLPLFNMCEIFSYFPDLHLYDPKWLSERFSIFKLDFPSCWEKGSENESLKGISSLAGNLFAALQKVGLPCSPRCIFRRWSTASCSHFWTKPPETEIKLQFIQIKQFLFQTKNFKRQYTIISDQNICQFRHKKMCFHFWTKPHGNTNDLTNATNATLHPGLPSKHFEDTCENHVLPFL